MKSLTGEQRSLVNELKMGSYQQCRKYLKRFDEYSVLGVACDIYHRAVGGLRIVKNKDNIYTFNSHSSHAPAAVVKYFGLRSKSGYLGKTIEIKDKNHKTLLSLNDYLSFKEIGEMMEKNSEIFFKMSF